MKLYRRGGSCCGNADFCRVAYKGYDSASYQNGAIGFRLFWKCL
jgi:formylglycine-generating enzyme required for sulfatase activity